MTIMPIAVAAISTINFRLNNFKTVRISVVSVFYVIVEQCTNKVTLSGFMPVYVVRVKQDIGLEMNINFFLSLFKDRKLNRTLNIFPVGGLLFYHRKIFVSGSWADVLTGPPKLC